MRRPVLKCMSDTISNKKIKNTEHNVAFSCIKVNTSSEF